MHLMWCRPVRRNALNCVSWMLAAILVVSWSGMAFSADERVIAIYNIHTKKTLKVTYKRDGAYIPAAMKKVNEIMGDWRRKTSREMDPKLIDLMWELHTELKSKKPIYLISGYRSLKTNNQLRKTRGGQARRSRHILGKAADVHFPDVPVRRLRNSALIRQQGGVGYYPTSAIPFVHLDTGRVRHWPRLGRYELAALFPKGKSRHVPKDGRPITRKDHRIAMAKLGQSQKRSIRLAHAWLKKSKRGNQKKTHHQLASLSGPVLSGGNGKSGSAFLSSWSSKQVTREQSTDNSDVKLASLDLGKRPALPGSEKNNDVYSGGWVGAPAYDDEHPDDLSYSPFPILPLMGERPISKDIQVMPLQAPDYRQDYYLFDEQENIMPLRFRPGLQFAQMLWANDFKGKAVVNLASPEQVASSNNAQTTKDQGRLVRSVAVHKE